MGRLPGYFVLLAVSINILCLWLYHHHFYRQQEVVTVDFRMLSEAKIGEWAVTGPGFLYQAKS